MKAQQAAPKLTKWSIKKKGEAAEKQSAIEASYLLGVADEKRGQATNKEYQQAKLQALKEAVELVKATHKVLYSLGLIYNDTKPFWRN